jgi:hypothetical protein
MDRRKALKKCGILLGTALSSSTIGVLFESFTLPRMKKIKCFFRDEEILNLLILLFQLQNSPGAKAAGVEVLFQL